MSPKMSPKMSEKMSEKNLNVERTIERDLAKLKKLSILTRKGGRKDGEWVLTDLGKSVFDKLTK
jgi:ATP-dependent DNA helicase RecG